MSQAQTHFPHIHALIEQKQIRDWHYLLAENTDWEIIPDALYELGLEIAFHPENTGQLLRIVAEIIYVLGYERGKREATMPSFVVKEQEAE